MTFALTCHLHHANWQKIKYLYPAVTKMAIDDATLRPDIYMAADLMDKFFSHCTKCS